MPEANLKLDQQPEPNQNTPHGASKLETLFPQLILLVFILLTGLMAFRSDGVWLDDDLCHYQIARLAWQHPVLLLSGWGRPGCTLPYAIVANIGSMAQGFRAARLLTVCMAGLVVWLTWQTGKRMQVPFAWLLPLVLLLMPEFFCQSFTPCTEIPAALYATAGTYFLVGGHRRWAAVFYAILPATRHELAPFLVPLGLYFLYRRDYAAALLLCWFELAWALVSWKAGETQPVRRYFTPQDSTPYGSGNFTLYFFNWIKMAGITMVMLSLVGILKIVWQLTGSSRHALMRVGSDGRRRRFRLLAVGGTVGLLLLETLLYGFNRFASGGYSMFLIPMAPLMAVCVCYGIAWVVEWIDCRVLMLVAIFPVWQFSRYVHPFRLTAHQQLIGRVISQLHHEDPACHIVGDSPWITYFDEASPGAREQNALETWKAGKATSLYYLYNELRELDTTLATLESVPMRLIRTEKIASTDLRPDLRIYRRLPNQTR